MGMDSVPLVVSLARLRMTRPDEAVASTTGPSSSVDVGGGMDRRSRADSLVRAKDLTVAGLVTIEGSRGGERAAQWSLSILRPAL